jgi:hypothetical protein
MRPGRAVDIQGFSGMRAVSIGQAFFYFFKFKGMAPDCRDMQEGEDDNTVNLALSIVLDILCTRLYRRWRE